jgi:hypothetical protein
VFVPAVLVYPAIVFLTWMGGALLYRAVKLRRSRAREMQADDTAANERPSGKTEDLRSRHD